MDDFNDVSEDVVEETPLQGDPYSRKKKRTWFIILISALCAAIVIGVGIGLIVGLTSGPPADPHARALYLMENNPLIGI
jgi:hypothetical protein